MGAKAMADSRNVCARPTAANLTLTRREAGALLIWLPIGLPSQIWSASQSTTTLGLAFRVNAFTARWTLANPRPARSVS